MMLGRVVGEIYSTINHPFYDSRTLLVVEKTDPHGKANRDYVIAVDVVGAGVGQRVLVLEEGNGARQVFSAADAPVRAVVVAIIDTVDAVPGTS